MMLILTFSIPPVYRSTSHGNCEFACHATPMLRKAAWVTACVSAVIRSCSRALNSTIFEPKQDRIRFTNAALASEARCFIMTWNQLAARATSQSEREILGYTDQRLPARI